MSNWMERYLTPLVGGKIIEVGETKEEDGEEYCQEGGWPYLVVEIGNNTHTITIEGNGPGFIHGLPDPTPE